MKKLNVVLIVIALVGCIACQRQQTETRKNNEIQRQVEERAAELQAQEPQVIQRETESKGGENSPKKSSLPASSISPRTAPEKRNALESQAQKFQPRRTVPMGSPPSDTSTSSEPLTDKLEKNRTAALQPNVPQEILEPILKQAGALAEVPRGELVIARADSVIWSDGSLGCPEPGMAYTQALVKGYWVIVEAGGKKYDFRVGSGGSFRLCPPGQGQPPSQPAAE